MGKRNLKILSIDDDQDCQTATARFFTLVGGHMVFAAESGAAGIEKAAAVKPDLIILDMRLPDMTGLKVMEKLYSDHATRNIPVIVFSGGGLSALESAELRTRQNLLCMVQKPTDMRELLRKIEAVLLSEAATVLNKIPAWEGSPDPA